MNTPLRTMETGTLLSRLGSQAPEQPPPTGANYTDWLWWRPGTQDARRTTCLTYACMKCEVLQEKMTGYHDQLQPRCWNCGRYVKFYKGLPSSLGV